MWSKWVWVSRIASSSMPSSSIAAEQPLGLVAGIDDQASVGPVAAEDVGVLGDLADGEAADVHRAQPLRACRAPAFFACALGGELLPAGGW